MSRVRDGDVPSIVHVTAESLFLQRDRPGADSLANPHVTPDDMRYALISDIHANLPALDSVLADRGRADPLA